jgi:hypothetical protein
VPAAPIAGVEQSAAPGMSEPVVVDPSVSNSGSGPMAVSPSVLNPGDNSVAVRPCALNPEQLMTRHNTAQAITCESLHGTNLSTLSWTSISGERENIPIANTRATGAVTTEPGLWSRVVQKCHSASPVLERCSPVIKIENVFAALNDDEHLPGGDTNPGNELVSVAAPSQRCPTVRIETVTNKDDNAKVAPPGQIPAADKGKAVDWSTMVEEEERQNALPFVANDQEYVLFANMNHREVARQCGGFTWYSAVPL